MPRVILAIEFRSEAVSKPARRYTSVGLVQHF
jgi:hypothetical protein